MNDLQHKEGIEKIQHLINKPFTENQIENQNETLIDCPIGQKLKIPIDMIKPNQRRLYGKQVNKNGYFYMDCRLCNGKGKVTKQVADDYFNKIKKAEEEVKKLQKK